MHVIRQLNIADVDECLNSTVERCDANSLCQNTFGSYDCTCKPGFDGDGYSCTGHCNKAHSAIKTNNLALTANTHYYKTLVIFSNSCDWCLLAISHLFCPFGNASLNIANCERKIIID